MAITAEQIQAVIDSRFGGKLLAGSHEEDGKACILKCLSVVRGIPCTDEPSQVRSFDIRGINDIPVSIEVRTPWMVRLAVAYDGSLDWPKERKWAVVKRIAILTVNRLIAGLPGISTEIAKQCRDARTIDAAADAADAAAGRAADAAVYAAAARAADAAGREEAREGARAVARAARAAADAVHAADVARAAARAESAADAADAAADAAREKVFISACEIWLEAAAAVSE
jgi:hypothetical protein